MGVEPRGSRDQPRVAQARYFSGAMSTAAQLLVGGERQSGASIRSQNGN